MTKSLAYFYSHAMPILLYSLLSIITLATVDYFPEKLDRSITQYHEAYLGKIYYLQCLFVIVFLITFTIVKFIPSFFTYKNLMTTEHFHSKLNEKCDTINKQSLLPQMSIILSGFGFVCFTIFISKLGLSIGNYSALWENRKGSGNIYSNAAQIFYWCSICTIFISPGSKLKLVCLNVPFYLLPLLFGVRSFVVIPIAVLIIVEASKGNRKLILPILSSLILIVIALLSGHFRQSAKDRYYDSNFERVMTELNSINLSIGRSVHLRDNFGHRPEIGTYFYKILSESIPKSEYIMQTGEGQASINLVLMQYFNKWKYKRGMTEGGAIVAEFYYIYGVIGVALVGVLYGVFAALSSFCWRHDMAKILSVVCLVALSWSVRNSLISLTKTAILATIVLLFAITIFTLKNEIFSRKKSTVS